MNTEIECTLYVSALYERAVPKRKMCAAQLKSIRVILLHDCFLPILVQGQAKE